MNIPPLIPRSSQSVWLSCPILQCPHSYSSIFRFPCLPLLWIFRKPLPPSFGTVSVMACLLGLICYSIAGLHYILHLGMWCVFPFFSTQWCVLWYQIVYCFLELLLCQIKKPSSLLGREKILFECRVIMLRKASGESITWELDFKPHRRAWWNPWRVVLWACASSWDWLKGWLPVLMNMVCASTSWDVHMGHIFGTVYFRRYAYIHTQNADKQGYIEHLGCHCKIYWSHDCMLTTI